MKKKLFIGIGALFIGLLLWRIVLLIIPERNNNSLHGKRPPVAVEVDSIRFGPLTEKLQLTGTIYPEYQYVVAPKVAGRVMAIKKRIGDRVRAGELIARIDDAEYQQNEIEADANLKIALASQEEARIQFELAGQEKKRVEQLQEKGIASPSELDAAISNYTAQQSRYQLAQAQVEQRQAALNSARIRQGYTRLTASKQGFIGERYVDEGALLAANAPVVSVIGISTVIVRTSIIERDYGKVKQGQQAVVTVDAFSSKPFTGMVTRIAPMLQETSRVAQMEVEIENDSLVLKPGMFVHVEVVIAANDKAQYVPGKAVVNHKGVTGVFMVARDETITHYYAVHTGIETPQFTEIVSPKLSGMVITLGQHLLDDGGTVILPAGAGEDTEKMETTGRTGEKKK